ncbi:hypothetical protein ACHAWX_001691 [Stephanocyclus meneghinianus]
MPSVTPVFLMTNLLFGRSRIQQRYLLATQQDSLQTPSQSSSLVQHVTAALCDMGLKPSIHDPCLFSGTVKSTNTSTNETVAPINVGIYVDYFVFYSTDPVQEARFMGALKQRVVVDFMGPVDWFLGPAFTWRCHEDGNLSVLLSQSVFTEYTAHRFAVNRIKPVPNTTPYRSGLPIDSIPNAPPNNPDQKCCTKVYQSILLHSPFLPLTINVHLIVTIKQPYMPSNTSTAPLITCLTSFSDACWGGQFGNAIPDGTPLELFKFCSISGYVICHTGGPISWKSIRQNCTSLSSCEAEIVATSECMTELENVHHLAIDLGISNANEKIMVYNDNDACVQWSASVTNKGTNHMNLKENYVRKAHQLGLAQVKHIPGIVKASNIFTKELKDAAHFCHCRDSMMVSRINFEKYGHVMPSHCQNKDEMPYYNALSPQPLESYRHTLLAQVR